MVPLEIASRGEWWRIGHVLRKGTGGEGLREMDLRVWSPCGWSLWSLPVATEIPRVSLRTDFGWLKNRVLRSEGGH